MVLLPAIVLGRDGCDRLVRAIRYVFKGDDMKAILLLLPLTVMAADKAADRLVKEVRHELVMLPYYNVFDNLAYRVDGGKVTLFGQVVRPTLKSDAEKAVKQIEGV